MRGQRLLDNAPCQAVAGLDSGALLFPRYCASLVQTKADRHANGSPFGGAGERSETERARPLTANPRHCDSIALTKSLPIAAQRLFRAGLALSVTFGDTSPQGRGFGRPHRFLYLFGELYVIMVLRPCPPIYSGGEVRKMESILSFILSVGANVAAYYICKWLDGWFKDRKH